MENGYTLKTVFIMLIVALLLSYTLMKALSIVLNTELPLAVVSSWSMEPTLHIGDLIVVSGIEPEIGDIIVYSRGKYIVHRVISKSEAKDGFSVVTKGDANAFSDGSISWRQIKGKVVLVLPYIGVLKLLSENFIISFLFSLLWFFYLQKIAFT